MVSTRVAYEWFGEAPHYRRMTAALFTGGDGRPRCHWCAATPPLTLPQGRSECAESKQLSKALKARGWRFVGPTTVYAFMQAAGLVNDHAAGNPGNARAAELVAIELVRLRLRDARLIDG